MAKDLQPDEIEQEYCRTMGRELGSLFHCLWNECSHLHWKWNEHVVLFGSNSERVKLLNEAAPSFFWIIQSMMWEDILLHISRLVDPEKSVGKTNLTLFQLPRMIDPSMRENISGLLSKAKECSAFARDWRMRHIAHRDLSLALETSVRPLTSASRGSVKAALAAIADVLNAIEMHYTGSTVAYENFISRGGAEDLLYVINDGLISQRSFSERLETGELLPEDLVSKPAL